MMKKALVILLLAAFVVPVFADDALTLPAGVMRTRIIPSMTFVNQWFDDEGNRVESIDVGVGTLSSIQLYNLSVAIEYGITDWLTAGLQWTPGWTFLSNADFSFNAALAGLGISENNQFVSRGINDLFVGAKVQVMGDQGIVPNSAVRIAVTPGVKIPLTQYSASDEVTNFSTGKEFQPSAVDEGAWALGGRFALDYIVTPDLFLNFFHEATFYLPTAQERFNVPTVDASAEITPGTELKFEVEASYTMPLGNGVRLGFGLPVTYQMTLESKVDGTGQDDASWILGVGPSVSAFFTDWALPMEFELGYNLPLAGKDSPIANTIQLQIKNFLRF